jgi:amino acid permease
MEVKQLWRGIRPLLGTVVGVGIFGLPYAFSRVGFGLGLLALVVVCGLSIMALLLYADLILVRNGHGRYLSVVGHDLSFAERAVAAVAYFGSNYGALLAYVIVGGSFAHSIFSPWLGGSLLLYQCTFWLIGSLVIGGGLSFIVRLQGFLFPLIFLLVIVHAFLLVPHLSFSHFGEFHPENTVLSLGILLFAFGGLSAVPDMRDVLGKNRSALRSSLVIGMLSIMSLYALFCFLVVGVSGPLTTPEAISGLSTALGPFAEILGSVLGLGIVLSAYLALGVGLTSALVYDFRMRYLAAWAAVALVPITLVILGATNFISVVGITGGILGSLLGMFLVVAYERARYSHQLSKYALGIPQWLVALTFMMYAVMFVLTIVELFWR